MAFESKGFGRDPDIDYTPMIDMTFQLITFFMFTLNFSQADFSERVSLPLSELAKPPEAALDRVITLQLAARGPSPDGKQPGPLLAQPVLIYNGQDQPVGDLKRIMENEKEWEKRVLRTEGKKEEDWKNTLIIIRADSDAKTGDVQGLIKAAQTVGFEKFVLRATQEVK